MAERAMKGEKKVALGVSIKLKFKQLNVLRNFLLATTR